MILRSIKSRIIIRNLLEKVKVYNFYIGQAELIK